MRVLSALLAIIFLPSIALAQVPNDPFFSEQWYLPVIDAPDAWDVTTGEHEVVVAVLDTGIDLDHPDLEDMIWENGGEVEGDGIDNDGNGYIDDIQGWDFINDDNDPGPSFGNGVNEEAAIHGTLIASVIASETDNGEGIAGINWNAKLMPIRMLDSLGSGDTFAAAEAIDYAVENGADVINMSFSGIAFDARVEAAVERAYNAGVFVVAAVGNNANGGDDLDEDPEYPACFYEGNEDWVFGVAALSESSEKASFSNYGRDCTDISAPGVNIFGARYQDSNSELFLEGYGGGYSGTSVAAPQVAGAAALVLSLYPSLSVGDLQLVLQLSVDPISTSGTDYTGKLGTGKLNISSALNIASRYADASSASSGGDNLAFAFAEITGGSQVETIVDAESTIWQAYGDGFTGGVRIALGDIDGDGMAEVITGAGQGGGPHIRLFELDGSLIGQFFAYSESYRGGVYVASGDLTGNGVDEIIVSPGVGGERNVIVFDSTGNELLTMRPFEGLSDVRASAGDIDGDGLDELVFASGIGRSPELRLYESDGTYLRSIEPYAEGFIGGVYPEARDINLDGKDEIITGTGVGGGPHVRIFDQLGNVIDQFFAEDASNRNGVIVSAGQFPDTGEGFLLTTSPVDGSTYQLFDVEGWNFVELDTAFSSENGLVSAVY